MQQRDSSVIAADDRPVTGRPVRQDSSRHFCVPRIHNHTSRRPGLSVLPSVWCRHEGLQPEKEKIRLTAMKHSKHF